MNDHFSDLFEAASSRTVTVRSADGHPMVQAKLLHAAAVAAAGVILAPRIAAAAAVGGLFSGFTLSIDEQPGEDAVTA